MTATATKNVTVDGSCADSLPCLGDCLKAVEAGGFTLTLDGGLVRMAGPAPPSPVLLAMLGECKPLLIPLLKVLAAGARPTWRDAVMTWPTVTYRAYRAVVDGMVATGAPLAVAERRAYPTFQNYTPKLLGMVREDTP